MILEPAVVILTANGLKVANPLLCTRGTSEPSESATGSRRTASRTPANYDGAGARERVLPMTPADRQRAAATIFRAHAAWELQHILEQCDARIAAYLRPMVARAALHPNRER
jgi:hypothetical protein